MCRHIHRYAPPPPQTLLSCPGNPWGIYIAYGKIELVFSPACRRESLTCNFCLVLKLKLFMRRPHKFLHMVCLFALVLVAWPCLSISLRFLSLHSFQAIVVGVVIGWASICRRTLAKRTFCSGICLGKYYGSWECFIARTSASRRSGQPSSLSGAIQIDFCHVHGWPIGRIFGIGNENGF